MKTVMEINFYIFYKGRLLDRDVGFYYVKGNEERKKLAYERLLEDFPANDGYKLVFKHEKPAFEME